MVRKVGDVDVSFVCGGRRVISLPVVWLQIQMAKMAQAAHESGETVLPKKYERLMRGGGSCWVILRFVRWWWYIF